jgi:hypothetical protein
MRLVILESPYAGDIDANVEFARACVRDSLSRGEAPIASHLLYTQPGILRDEIAEERQWGIDAGLAWANAAAATVVYQDRGISLGMKYGIKHAMLAGRPVEYRCLNAPETRGWVMTDHKTIYLSPDCGDCERTWCSDPQDCDECGAKAVKYMLASDLADVLTNVRKGILVLQDIRSGYVPIELHKACHALTHMVAGVPCPKVPTNEW